jgi:hypothetical protein
VWVAPVSSPGEPDLWPPGALDFEGFLHLRLL